jgi:hypothetical protein
MNSTKVQLGSGEWTFESIDRTVESLNNFKEGIALCELELLHSCNIDRFDNSSTFIYCKVSDEDCSVKHLVAFVDLQLFTDMALLLSSLFLFLLIC